MTTVDSHGAPAAQHCRNADPVLAQVIDAPPGLPPPRLARRASPSRRLQDPRLPDGRPNFRQGDTDDRVPNRTALRRTHAISPPARVPRPPELLLSRPRATPRRPSELPILLRVRQNERSVVITHNRAQSRGWTVVSAVGRRVSRGTVDEGRVGRHCRHRCPVGTSGRGRGRPQLKGFSKASRISSGRLQGFSHK
jgi:hypothetical protein